MGAAVKPEPMGAEPFVPPEPLEPTALVDVEAGPAEMVAPSDYASVAFMGAMLVAAQLLALLVVAPFEEAGVRAFEDPEDPKNPFIYLGIIVAFTALILLIAKLRKQWIIQLLILGSIGATMVYVFWPLLTQWVGDRLIPQIALSGVALAALVAIFAKFPWKRWFTWALVVLVLAWPLLILYRPLGDLVLATSVAGAMALTWLLYKYPEWWVVDAVGVLVSAGAIAIFGISFGILPALILLVALAVYDYVSVYRTKHMISLADNVMQLRLPIMLIVPKHRGYSFLEESTHLKDDLAKGKKRDAMFMGLGDVVIPSILAVVAFHKALDFATLGALAGTLLGFLFLMTMVLRGKAHAGLPSLNGGAMLGFFLGLYVDTGTVAFWTL